MLTIWRILEALGEEQLTRHELACDLGCTVDQLSPQLVGLRRSGLVVSQRARLTGRRGRPADLFHVTARGRALLEDAQSGRPLQVER